MSNTARRMTVPYDINQESGTILDILAKYTQVCANEFCGKCMPCRYGTKEWTFIIDRLIRGEGSLKDLEQLKTINHSMKTASLCRLGLISPFLIDTILQYHSQSIAEYITNKTPLPTNIKELPKFIINTSSCNGCPSEEKAPCKQACSINAITGEKGELHSINQDKCYRCNECVPVCPTSAISFI